MRRDSDHEAEARGEYDMRDRDKELEGMSVSFFLMPTEIMRDLYDDFSRLLDPERAGEMLYRHGFDCGRIIIERIHNYEDRESLFSNLNDVWIEVGLGIIALVEENDGDYLFQCAECNEAKANGEVGRRACNFSRGYLAGMMSAVTKESYKCTEEACLSNGEGYCLYRLVPE